MAIWKNLLRFCKQNRFNKDLAKKAFRHLTDAAARSYLKEIKERLDISDRREAEQDFVGEFMGASGCRPGKTFTQEMEDSVRREYGLKGILRCRCR